MTASNRTISRIEITPPPSRGFIGPEHTAVEVVRPDALRATDPFVLLMDDRLDMNTRRQIGGAHPHAGLETVTLLLEGTLYDRDESQLSPGDAIWMSAGKGIVHAEANEASGRTRILQLWIALSARDRQAEPRFEVIRRDATLFARQLGAEAHLYSGTLGSLRSPTPNRVPVTMADLALEPRATFEDDLPSSYNGFVYVLDGAIQIGTSTIAASEVGWLEPSDAGRLAIRAGNHGARMILYAGQPLGESLVHQGPFVGGSARDIADSFQRFRAGQFIHMSQLARMHK